MWGQSLGVGALRDCMVWLVPSSGLEGRALSLQPSPRHPYLLHHWTDYLSVWGRLDLSISHANLGWEGRNREEEP